MTPAARASYVSAAGPRPTEVRLDAGVKPLLLPPSQIDLKKVPNLPTLDDTPVGSLTPSPSGSGGSGPAPGFVPPAEVPAAHPVVYYRASAGRLVLPAFAAFILDPPRSH